MYLCGRVRLGCRPNARLIVSVLANSLKIKCPVYDEHVIFFTYLNIEQADISFCTYDS